jgi:hypothetical protein
LAVGFPLGKKVLLANFYEKALFVKPTWRLPRGRVQRLLCPSRYASIRTLGKPTLLGSPVHRMRSVFSSQRRCNLLLSGLSSSGMDQVRMAHSPLDPKRVRASLAVDICHFRLAWPL